jgi:hypothetical protein
MLIGLASPCLELRDPTQGFIGLTILLVGIRIAWRITAGTSARFIGEPAAQMTWKSTVPATCAAPLQSVTYRLLKHSNLENRKLFAYGAFSNVEHCLVESALGHRMQDLVRVILAISPARSFRSRTATRWCSTRTNRIPTYT